jgi:hypothetical protein
MTNPPDPTPEVVERSPEFNNKLARALQMLSTIKDEIARLEHQLGELAAECGEADEGRQ